MGAIKSDGYYPFDNREWEIAAVIPESAVFSVLGINKVATHYTDDGCHTWEEELSFPNKEYVVYHNDGNHVYAVYQNDFTTYIIKSSSPYLVEKYKNRTIE